MLPCYCHVAPLERFPPAHPLRHEGLEDVVDRAYDCREQKGSKRLAYELSLGVPKSRLC